MNQKLQFSKTMRLDIPPLPPGADGAAPAVTPPARKPSKRVHLGPLGTPDFQELLQSVYDAALITTLDGHIIEANGRAVHFFGFERDELCATDILGVVSGASPEVLSTIRQSLESDRFILIQAYGSRQDGSLFPVEIAVNRLHLSGQDYLCFFVRDTTLRRQAEDELRTQHNAIENAEDGIAIADLDGRIGYVNPSALWLCGFPSMDQVSGMRLGDFLGDEPTAEEILAAVHSRRTWTGGLRIDHPDGRTVFMRVAVAPNMDRDDRLVGMVCSILDITGLRRTEAELREMMQELRRSNADLEQFAYVASHDLQEPLRKVRSFGDLLQSSCADSLPPIGLDYIQRMQAAARRMQDMIHGLLDLSRVSTRQQVFTAVDLGEALRGVLGDLDPRLRETNGRIEAGELPTIDADPVQMRQLLQNLVGNALKFHRKDVPPLVRITCRRLEPASGQIQAGLADDVCSLSVEDNGIGFDPADADRMFEVFQRLQPRGEYEGTGIGLAICRKIVERHGGTITAEGRPGQGSTFTMTLPLRQHPRQTPGRD